MAETSPQQDHVITALADWHAAYIVDQHDLALAFRVGERTIQNMIARHDLPPAFMKLDGRSLWLVGSLLEHFQRRAEAAERDAEVHERKVVALNTPGARA